MPSPTPSPSPTPGDNQDCNALCKKSYGCLPVESQQQVKEDAFLRGCVAGCENLKKSTPDKFQLSVKRVEEMCAGKQ